jgi:hypothetical protein
MAMAPRHKSLAALTALLVAIAGFVSLAQVLTIHIHHRHSTLRIPSSSFFTP